MTIDQKKIEVFRRHLHSEEKSRNTIAKYVRDVKAFSDYAAGNAITKELVLDYKQHLIDVPYAVKSINSMLASVNAFLHFNNLYDCCVKPLRVQRQVFCPKERELTRNEYNRLVAAAYQQGNKRLGLIVQTICGTGIRVSELQHITLNAVRSGQAVVSCKAKTRVVILVSALRKVLLRYAAEQGISSGCIFITRTGKPIDRSNVWREMKSLCRMTGIDPGKVFPHNLRHLFARVFYGLEKDIAKLADILGHSSVDTTRIYIISTGTEHRRRMERMQLVTT